MPFDAAFRVEYDIVGYLVKLFDELLVEYTSPIRATFQALSVFTTEKCTALFNRLYLYGVFVVVLSCGLSSGHSIWRGSEV